MNGWIFDTMPCHATPNSDERTGRVTEQQKNNILISVCIFFVFCLNRNVEHTNRAVHRSVCFVYLVVRSVFKAVVLVIVWWLLLSMPSSLHRNGEYHRFSGAQGAKWQSSYDISRGENREMNMIFPRNVNSKQFYWIFF